MRPAAEARGELGEAVRSHAHEREAVESLTELTILRQGEGKQVVLEAEWCEAADVLDPGPVEPIEHLIGRVERLVRKTKDIVGNRLVVECVVALVKTPHG